MTANELDLDALKRDLDRFGYDPAHPEYATMRTLIAELEATRASYNAEESRAERAEAELEDARRDTFSRSGHGNVDHWCERAERAEAELRRVAGFDAWRPFPNECAECVARQMRCHCG